MTFVDPVHVGHLVTRVPPLALETGAGRSREHEAQLRRNNRLAERQAILRARGEYT